MSFNITWDLEKYRDDHESDEHWELRRAFLMRWRNEYPEERLVCLARVFANMEFMGCRYPSEVMHEVARLSQEIVKDYRNSRKTKLQRTFVSASTAAEDRAKGVKRAGGIIVDAPPSKSAKIDFIKQGQQNEEPDDSDKEKDGVRNCTNDNIDDNILERRNIDIRKTNIFLQEMMNLNCLNVKYFKDSMFRTSFGRMVLLIRPWANKLWNIQTSSQVCGINFQGSYENGCFSVTLNGSLVARASGSTKAEAKSIAEEIAWNRLREEVISVVVKEQWIAQGDARISICDVTGNAKRNECFGTPLDNSVAAKMMKLMGWKGGGLGADSQGIAEPINPNMQMVNRAGLGSTDLDIHQLRRAANELMRRYITSDTLDLDLVFSSEFSKEERAALHQCAQRIGLASKSYGDKDRFLVVKKKLDPFSLVRAVIEKGGITPKYHVFIPASLQRNGR